jgi:hypothetical protein
MIFPPYFTTSSSWSDFWIQAHHDLIDSFEIAGERVYAWKGPLSQIFWYIPHLGHTQVITPAVIKILTTEAKNQKVCWITTELDDTHTILPEISTQWRPALKKLQYAQTITLPAAHWHYEESLVVFAAKNTPCTAQWSATARRKLKKSLTYGWSISTTKDAAALAHFLELYHETARRQVFAIHPDEYYTTLFENPHSRIIILYSPQNTVAACWFGFVSTDTLTYLYGGNNAESLAHDGQYIVQLAALQQCAQEKLMWYDMGGYEQNTGYGRFKEGFHGILRTFEGPFDIVINTTIYTALSTLSRVKKILKK